MYIIFLQGRIVKGADESAVATATPAKGDMNVDSRGDLIFGKPSVAEKVAQVRLVVLMKRYRAEGLFSACISHPV